MSQTSELDQDYPLSEVPPGQRKGIVSTSIVLFGFTFFTATMFAGGKIGLAFDFKTMILAAVAGNLLLGLYAAVLGYIACRSGLNSVLMGRFCFGKPAASCRTSCWASRRSAGMPGAQPPSRSCWCACWACRPHGPRP